MQPNFPKKTLFVHQGQRSFFDRDKMILESFTQVVPFDNYPVSFKKGLKLFFKMLPCDLVYIWFMGKHAVLPLILAKLLGKKVVLVAGGWDVADCPEIDYGLMRPSSYRFLIKGLFQLPDLILSISKANHQDLLKNAGVHERKTRIVYLGFEDDAADASQKEKIVITVGEVNQNNLKRKGLELFVRSAAHFPEVPFVLIGKWSSTGAITFLKSIATPNVEFTGLLSDKDLKRYMSRAHVYAQLSYHEAFGAALAEAMLHQCVPVVTNQYSLPEVAGDAGYAAPLEDLAAITESICSALENSEKGKMARERILNLFQLTRRQEELRFCIQGLVHS